MGIMISCDLPSTLKQYSPSFKTDRFENALSSGKLPVHFNRNNTNKDVFENVLGITVDEVSFSHVPFDTLVLTLNRRH